MKQKSKTENSDMITIYPGPRLSGRVRVPGDKSISHRVAILSALASGTSSIRGILRAEDCLNTIGALEGMGAGVDFEGDVLNIKGTGGRLRQPDHALDLGNSGTGMRLLTGVVAGRPMTVELTGDRSLRSRPMKRIKEPLERMGAAIDLLGENGCAPIRIRGGGLRGIDYEMPVASAQVKSCILLASLFSRGVTRIRERLPTRDHTERLFRAMGIPIRTDGTRIEMNGFGPEGPRLAARSWSVPGDFSSAAFWIAAASMAAGASVTIDGVGLNPGRMLLIDVLKRMGADIRVEPDPASECPEPCGEIRIKGGALRGTEVGGNEIPGAIDELPLVAVIGALAQGVTAVRDAGELRVKESDRIASTAANLRLLGVTVDERDDGLVVHGGAPIRGNTRLDSYGDHRIAMAMAILALHASAPVVIEHVACVDTSYPGFWQDMRSIGAHVELGCGD